MTAAKTTIPNRDLYPRAWAHLSDERVRERADAILFLRLRAESMDPAGSRALLEAANALADAEHEGCFGRRSRS